MRLRTRCDELKLLSEHDKEQMEIAWAHHRNSLWLKAIKRMKLSAYRSRVVRYLAAKRKHDLAYKWFDKFKDRYFIVLTKRLKSEKAHSHHQLVV